VADRLDQWRKLSYEDLAIEVMKLYVDLPSADIERIVRKSYSTFSRKEITPVVAAGDVTFWNCFMVRPGLQGLALQVLGNLFEYILKESGRDLNSSPRPAATRQRRHSWRARPERIRIFVMHPHGRVSAIQEQQMTRCWTTMSSTSPWREL